MTDWTLLLPILQALLGAAGLLLLARRVFPALDPLPRPDAFLDVWIPLVLVVPLLAGAALVDRTVGGAGWLPVGAPAVLGLVALGAVLLRGSGRMRPGPRDRRAALSLVGAGLVLLLLGAAHDLTIWTGQSAFVAAAVLLWMNTPGDGNAGAAAAPAARAGVGLLAGLVLAAAQGVCVLLVDETARPVAAGVAVVYGAVGLGLAAVIGGPGPALRIGAWTASLGTLFGVGTISVLHLLPQAVQVLADPETRVSRFVARGFGVYAGEGLLLLLLPAAALVLLPLSATARRGAGMVVILLAVAVVAHRILSM